LSQWNRSHSKQQAADILNKLSAYKKKKKKKKKKTKTKTKTLSSLLFWQQPGQENLKLILLAVGQKIAQTKSLQEVARA
jgi:hypothetical protein